MKGGSGGVAAPGRDGAIEENPDLVEAFDRAMRRSLEASDDDAMRAASEGNTQTPPEVVPELALANWQADLDTEKLQLVGELAAEYGLLEDEPDLDALVWDGG
jgi:NitT/TauT family transport system substrate-binding protein